jgi:DNA modification methylase
MANAGIRAGKSAEPRGDSGSAARFFYCAKATTEERGEGNNHPTVKPVELMRWLTRLVTPKGGLVLDPFMGSGSTALACDAEQFNFIGCELSADYAAIAERRIRDAAGMFADISVEHAPNARAA